MWVEGSTYFNKTFFPSFLHIHVHIHYIFVLYFSNSLCTQLPSPHIISYIATDREKKIAQHAKAKREAEKRRGKGKGWFVLYYGLKSPPAPPRGMNILLMGGGGGWSIAKLCTYKCSFFHWHVVFASLL